MTEEKNIESNENVKPIEEVEVVQPVENTAAPVHTVSVDLSKEQYNFLVKWQKEHESELGIDVPLGSMVRKSVDIAMKSQKDDSDRKPSSFGDRKPGGFGGDRKPGGFGGDRKPGGFGGDRKSGGFGDRKPGGFGGDRKPGGFGDRRSGPRTSLLPKSPRRF